VSRVIAETTVVDQSALTGASALIVTLAGRPGDAVTAAITTAVVMGVVAVTPQDAWQQPILRLVDTAVGVAVGGVAVLLVQSAMGPRHAGAGGYCWLPSA
jgi:uncharacterized membrane protein YccC